MTDAPLMPISTPDAPKPAGHYAQAMVHGDLVYVSGQLPVRPDGTHLTQAAFPEQAAQALANLLAILRAAGCGPERVLKVTVYIAGVEHWPAFDSAFAAAFGSWHPARAVVPVPALHHGYLVEVDAVAAR